MSRQRQAKLRERGVSLITQLHSMTEDLCDARECITPRVATDFLDTLQDFHAMLVEYEALPALRRLREIVDAMETNGLIAADCIDPVIKDHIDGIARMPTRVPEM